MMKHVYAAMMSIMVIVDISAMGFIEKALDWHHERQAKQFIENFSSKTCADNRINMRSMSCNARKKIFENDAAKDSELHSAALILTALPYELQKTILENIDPIFTDHETTKYFLNAVPLKNILRWYAAVDKKMRNNPSYLFEKRTLFGQDFSYEVTKAQMLRLSIDEVVMLEGLRDGQDDKLSVSRYKNYFNKKQLVVLLQLMKKGYIPSITKTHSVDVYVDYTWLKMLEAFSGVFLPAIATHCALGVLISFDPAINNEMRKANMALEALEAIGQGPYLKHRLEEFACSTGSIFKCFLAKFLSLFSIPVVKIMFLAIESPKKKPEMTDALGMLSSLLAPGLLCCCFFSYAIQSMVWEVKVSHFQYAILAEMIWGLSVEATYVVIDYVLKDDKNFPSRSNKKTINIAEVAGYLNGWLVPLM